MSEAGLSSELFNLLGKEDFLRLVEAFGGSRLYVPASEQGTALSKRLGGQAAAKLARSYAKTYVRVPLARELRARHYRAAGHSNAEIARRLGMTESGIDQLFARMVDKPRKGEDPRQLQLFS